MPAMTVSDPPGPEDAAGPAPATVAEPEAPPPNAPAADDPPEDALPEATVRLLRRLLDERKLSQRQIADELHVTPTTVNRWLLRRQGVPLGSLRWLAARLGVTLAELFSERGEHPGERAGPAGLAGL